MSMPKLLTTMQSCKSVRPGPPKASETRPEYVADLEARVNLKIMSMEDSVNVAPNTIMISPGISPSCFMVAGRAMIPAPTIVVERLNTAPEYDAPSKPTSRSSHFWDWGRRRGARGPRRYFRSEAEGIIVIFEREWVRFWERCWVLFTTRGNPGYVQKVEIQVLTGESE